MADTKQTVLGFFTALGLLLYLVLAVFTDLSTIRIIAAVMIVGFVVPQVLVRALLSHSSG